MAAITKVSNLEILQFNKSGVPIRLSEASGEGSTSFKLDNPVYLEDGVSLVTKEVIVTFITPQNKYLTVYLPAGSFTDAQTISNAGIKRGLLRGGLDITAIDTSYDIPLPQGSEIVKPVTTIEVEQLKECFFGTIASGGTELVIGDETASTMTLSVKDNVGKKFLVRRNIAGYAEYSNDGTTPIRMDTAAPANVTTRTTTAALANNGEFYQDTADSNSVHLKDNGGDDIKLIDDATQKIPKTTVQKYSAASTTGNDTYVITLTPAPASLAAIEGIPIIITVDTDNTGACTLNVNGLGAKAIYKGNNMDMETGDIKANTLYHVAYHLNTDSFKLLSPYASQMSTANSTDLTDGGSTILHFHTRKPLQSTRAMNAASSNVDIAHGLGSTPKYVHVIAKCAGSTSATSNNNDELNSNGDSDGTNNYCTYYGGDSVGGNPYPIIYAAGNSATACVYIKDVQSDVGATDTIQSATITMDATNVTLNWTKGGSGSFANTIYLTLIVYI